MKFARSIAAIAATVMLSSCAPQTPSSAQPQVTKYAGYYNTIEGQLSDGAKFTGIGWFRDGRRTGDFCIKSGDLVCSGTYGPTLARVLKGTMQCTGGLTATFTTLRLPKGNFIQAVKASGTLSDGRTGDATFGPIQSGSGTTICLR